LKLLVDENLSRKLVSNLLDLFPGSIHLSQADLLQSPDFVVWEYAKANGFAILSADADFFELASTLGATSGYVDGAILLGTRNMSFEEKCSGFPPSKSKLS